MLMQDDGILAEILPEATGAAMERLEQLRRNEDAACAGPDGLRRLAALLPTVDAAAVVAARLRLSKRQRERLERMTDYRQRGLAMPVRQLAYTAGLDGARDCWLLGGAPDDMPVVAAALTGWSVPQLPLKGGALVARGVDAGPEVARLLRSIEERWIAADFPAGDAFSALLDQMMREERQ
jgi:poly(A) polymerase